MLDAARVAGARGRTRAPSSGRRKWREPSGPSEVEDGREVDVDAAAPQRRARRLARGERLGRRAVRARRPRRRRVRERTHVAALLVDEDERPGGRGNGAAPALDEHAADAARRREAGDDDERGLLLGVSARRRRAAPRASERHDPSPARDRATRVGRIAHVEGPAGEPVARRAARLAATPAPSSRCTAGSGSEDGGPKGEYFDLFWATDPMEGLARERGAGSWGTWRSAARGSTRALPCSARSGPPRAPLVGHRLRADAPRRLPRTSSRRRP